MELRAASRRILLTVSVVVVLVVVLAGAQSRPASAASAAGKRWSIVSSPSGAASIGNLVAASCPGASACVAVGTTEQQGTNAQEPLAETWNGKAWSVRAVPHPSGSQAGGLTGVSCSSAKACVAVGSFLDAASVQVPLAESWNGKAWSIQEPPDPAGATSGQLNGVSCQKSSCLAVGSYTNTSGLQVTLTEAWAGSKWLIKKSPNPAGTHGSSLASVSCVSPSSCMAVGSNTGSSFNAANLAERWKGTSWAIVRSGDPKGSQSSSLSGISCVGSICEAVGTSTGQSGFSATEAARWNGRSWSIQKTPNPAKSQASLLSSIWCVSASACTAVGNSSVTVLILTTVSTLAERWNGTSWSVQPTPDRSGAKSTALAGVACATATTCEGVGVADGSAYGAVWSARRWAGQAVPSPLVPQGTSLTGVACSGARFCSAVGTTSGPTGMPVPFAARWNGSSWAAQPIPNPYIASSTETTELNAVSCSSADACTAVGSFGDGQSGASGFAERWNGRRWSVQTMPQSSAFGDQLFGVACASAMRCLAVGDAADQAIAKQWNGKKWSLVSVPLPGGTTVSGLSSVSCASSSSCLAVGSAGTQTQSFALAERWNGTSWTLLSPANPAGAASSQLTAVSCPASACPAVGSYTDSTSRTFLLSDVWSGSSWSAGAIATPDHTVASGLTGVSCGSSTSCVAVGFFSTTAHNSMALAEGWNGTTWSSQPVPNPLRSFTTLNAVTCTNSSPCFAVGSASPTTSITAITKSLIERYS